MLPAEAANKTVGSQRCQKKLPKHRREQCFQLQRLEQRRESMFPEETAKTPSGTSVSRRSW
jgi:hypothetical protein